MTVGESAGASHYVVHKKFLLALCKQTTPKVMTFGGPGSFSLCCAEEAPAVGTFKKANPKITTFGGGASHYAVHNYCWHFQEDYSKNNDLRRPRELLTMLCAASVGTSKKRSPKATPKIMTIGRSFSLFCAQLQLALSRKRSLCWF